VPVRIPISVLQGILNGLGRERVKNRIKVPDDLISVDYFLETGGQIHEAFSLVRVGYEPLDGGAHFRIEISTCLASSPNFEQSKAYILGGSKGESKRFVSVPVLVMNANEDVKVSAASHPLDALSLFDWSAVLGKVSLVYGSANRDLILALGEEKKLSLWWASFTLEVATALNWYKFVPSRTVIVNDSVDG
jgi:hypothetical protein